MRTIQKKLSLPENLVQAVEEMAQQSGRDFSSLADEILAEGIRMRRCPGIYFADEPAGRRAKIAGTGLDVWDVIASHKAMGSDWTRLRKAFEWLAEEQLRDALVYYEAYPEEIDEQIARNEAWTPERIAREYPFLAPGSR